MHLYGLNDLNMTLEEFLSKSQQIASRKLKNEALALGQKIDRSQMTSTKHRNSMKDEPLHKDMGTGTDPQQTYSNSMDMTDSGAYTAIQMNMDSLNGIKDEDMRKQLH